MDVAAGVMCAVAGAGGLAALALPAPPGTHPGWMAGIATVALLWGAATLTFGTARTGLALPQRAVLAAVGIAVAGLLVWASGGTRSYLQPILIVAALHVGYFYPPRLAWPLTGLLVAGYAAPLAYDPHAAASGYPARVVLFALAVVGSDAIVRQLKGRLVQAERRQRAMAERDPLTGIANRRAFDVALDRALADPGVDGRAAALLLLDFDDFKRINDTHGHPVGDAVLKGVAGACASVVRGIDCLARIGGDEFAVVAPSAGPAGAERLAHALQEAVADAAMPEPLGPVGVTIAWATAPFDGTTPEQVMLVADHRLMARKRERRQSARAS